MSIDANGVESANEPDPAGRSRRRRRGWAVVLLVVAVLALIERHTTFRADTALPLVLGIAFIGWAIAARSCGLLIPGGILTGLGAGIIAEQWLGYGRRDGIFLLCFAGGWVLISVLSVAVFRKRVWWPLIPAAVIALTGLGQLGYPGLGWAWNEARNFWPYALIVLALVLLFRAPRAR